MYFVGKCKSISIIWQIKINTKFYKAQGVNHFQLKEQQQIYNCHMIADIEMGMFSVLQTWRQLQNVLKEKPDRERTEQQMQTEVNLLANQLKSAFENNHHLISSLEIPTLDQQETQQEHRKAVLDHKWAVSELVVWGEQLDNKIQNLLHDDTRSSDSR